MKPKTFVTLFLLLFVLGSAAMIFFPASAIAPRLPAASPLPEKPADRVIAYYFYGKVRCATCRTLEAYAQEALQTGFPQALAEGRLEWRPVNVDTPENHHFVTDYQLAFRSVVLAEVHDGREQRWKNLDEIWKLVNDKGAYLTYVQGETRAYLGE